MSTMLYNTQVCVSPQFPIVYLLWNRFYEGILNFFFLVLVFLPYPVLRNCKLVFLIMKISQYDGSRQWLQVILRYPFKNWYKNWYLHSYKTYDCQIWRAGTSIVVDSSETSQAGVGDVIMSRPRDKLKTSLHYHSAYGYQTWQDSNLPWWASAHKVTWPFDHMVL